MMEEGSKMAEKTNGLSPPQGGGFHRLPQIPTMSRNVKIAQSKTSAKLETVKIESVDEAAVIHIEGTDKVVKISSDGSTETTESALVVPPQETGGKEGENKNGQEAVPTRSPRKRRRSTKHDAVDTPKEKEKTPPKVKVESGRKKGKDIPKPSGSKRAGKNTLQAKSVANTESETPKSGSGRKAAKSTPKADLGKMGKKNTPGLGSSPVEKKSTPKALRKQPPSSELDSTQSASDTVSAGGGDTDKAKPVSKTTVSAIKSILESAPVLPEYVPEQTSGSKAPQESQETADVSKGETDANDRKGEADAKVSEKKASEPKDTTSKSMEKPQKAAEPKIKAAEPKMYYSEAGRILPRTVLLRESERPSDSQLARIMEGKTNEYDISHPVKWRIGDLLWGHVSGHPYWPGMISSDPFSGLFTTIKGGSRISRLYHVQYFGDEAERGWVGEASSMPFEGKQKMVDLGAAQIKVTKDRSKKNKLQQAFCPNQRRKAAWDLAVAEAEDALTLDKEERIDKYTFVYEFLPNKNPPKLDSTTKGATASPTSNSVEKRGLKRKEPLPDSDEGSDEEHGTLAPKRQRRDVSTPTSQRSRGREEGSFETYCIKHRESVREEHPDYSGSMVIEALKQQWALMTPQQRLRYKSKFSGTPAVELMEVESATGPNKRSPRKSRPSLKKLEAEGDRGPEDSRRQRRTMDTAESAMDTTEKEGTSETETSVRRRKRKSAAATEEEQTVSEASVSIKSKTSNDSDSNSDLQDEPRPKGRPPKMEEEYVLEIFKLNNTAPTKKENLCAVCEETGELVECHGVCQNYFHAACIDLKGSTEEFKCQECVSGEHKCFFCKKADKETKRCAVSQCGKFYHEECVKKMPHARFEGKGFTCPHHICATCAADSTRNPKSAKGRLYRCIRCPTAYHVGDFCIAAGSVHLGGYHILCSNHFQPVKSHKHHLRINVSWCFSCSKGGSLVCCETCPAAFHTDCANLTSMPEDAWYCSDCLSGKKPLYGDIIWIKIGNYRWWPAEICHPRNVPTNIQEMAHSVGEFPARFFGSHDYYWTHQGRVFLFQEGDRGSKDTSASRGLFKMYYKGVKEATEAFKLWKAAKENKEQIEQEKNDRKPAPFKFVKINVPVGNVQVNKADLSEIPRCECKPDQENPCSSDTECLNRMLMYECSPAVCPAKEACGNQRFQKRQYPESTPYRTESRGWGLKTLVDIKKGQFVNEYVGDLIDEEECKRRIEQAHEDNVTNFYMLTVDKNRIIDAGPKGNNSRFMNHSCEPNLETQKWTVNGDVRVGLFAIRDIPAGSELTFNYNLECLGNEKTKCSCGSENCSGFLGVRPKTQAAVAVEKKKKEKEGKKKKKRKHQEMKKEHEDECFRCGEGGELVMCDKPNCPKVYHLQCLNLAKPPHGKWLCPWHHCDVCGKLAIKLCSECPNSFCQTHEEGVITFIKGNLICAEHTELIEGLAASTSESTSAQSSSSSSSVDSDDCAEPAPPSVKEDPVQGPEAAGEKDTEAAEEKTPDSSVKDDSGAPSIVNTEVKVVNTEVKVDAEVKVDLEVKVDAEIKVDTQVKVDAEVKVEPTAAAAIAVKTEEVEAGERGSQRGSMDVASASSANYSSTNSTVKAAREAPKKRRSKGPGSKRATVCRTKARYKAQLKAGSASSSPLPGGTSPSLLNINTDSDNDSNGLIIDLPSH